MDDMNEKEFNTEEKKQVENTHRIDADDIEIPASELDRIAEPREADEKPQKKKNIKLFVILGIVAVLVIGAIFGIRLFYNLYFYSETYSGVSVGDIDCSGMNKKEVLAALTEAYEGKTPTESVNIRIGDKVYTLDIGGYVSYNLRETADNVIKYGKSGNMTQRMNDINEAEVHGVEINMSYTINDTGIETQIEKIAAEVKQELSQSSYKVEDGKLILDTGENGRNLDKRALFTFMWNKLHNGDLSDCEFELETNEAEKLDLAAIKAEIECEKKEPYIDLENDPSGSTVIEGTPGIFLDLEQAQRILDASTDRRIVEIPLTVTEPEHTAEEYSEKLFKDKLASSITPFTSSANRTTNVTLAAGFCNGKIIQPGEVFSYNDTVGPRTYERGFKDAIVYVGTSAEDGVGGGICQISSALYYCALRCDLEIVERHAHSRMVTYVPLGEDATVAWGSKDFKFRNNLEYPIKIVSYHTQGTVTMEIWGTVTDPDKTVEIETKTLKKTPFETIYKTDTSLAPGTEKVQSNGYTGYSTETFRIVKINGEEFSRTFENKSNYTKYDKVVLRNDTAPAVKPVEETPVTETPTQETPAVEQPQTPEQEVTPEITTGVTTPTDIN